LNARLAEEIDEFDLVKGGWKKDMCTICGWELSQTSGEDHSACYSNGRDWVCTECFEKFLKGPDYFSSSQPDST
jgi:hypothetical protein